MHAWYEAYETLDNSDQQAVFLLDTLRQPITQEDFDQSDLGSVLVDFVGDRFEREKRFEDTLDFLRQFEQLQPKLYAGEFHYYADNVLDYYCFSGQAEKAEPVIRFFKENPNADIDSFLPVQRAVWYWLKQDWGVQLAAETYQPVREHKGYWGNPEIVMALAMHTSSLQTVYEHWQRTGTFDPDAAKAVAVDYHFTLADIAQFEASFIKPAPRVENQGIPFDNFFKAVIPDPGSKPRSMYEKVFGHNPPTRSKKKRKKKKR